MKTEEAPSADFYDRFPIPLADPEDTGQPPPQAPSRRRHFLRRSLQRAAGRRRLAIIDTHFPWKLSGFRFHEFSEFHRQRPDTVFFSLYRMREAFDGPVYSLADFPRLAPALGVTDVYFVFLNLAIGLLGLAEEEGAAACPGVRSDISIRPTLRRFGMRTHVTLYPGGGLLPNTSASLLGIVASQTDTVFTNINEVEAAVAGAHLSHAVTATDFYSPASTGSSDPRRLVFAADDRPRKGLLTLIRAFNLLPEGFHLDIVGPHERHLGELRNTRWIHHGWLGPERLRDVYRAGAMFISPVTPDLPGEPGGEDGMVDGFPTSCALDAMSTGCCLVSSNPRREHRVFRPGVDYVEIPERDPEALAEAITTLGNDPERQQRIAGTGTERVREMVSVRAGVEEKLRAMAL